MQHKVIVINGQTCKNNNKKSGLVRFPSLSLCISIGTSEWLGNHKVHDNQHLHLGEYGVWSKPNWACSWPFYDSWSDNWYEHTPDSCSICLLLWYQDEVNGAFSITSNPLLHFFYVLGTAAEGIILTSSESMHPSNEFWVTQDNSRHQEGL